jgi:hypothetical protein
LPSKNEITFSVNASNEYTPETQQISFGYTANDGTITTYLGTVKDNTWTDGGAPYNMFYRYINADGSIFDHWYWVKDIPNSTDFTGELVIPYNTTFSTIEVVLSSAVNYLDVDDSNIVDKEIIPIIKSGKKGIDAQYIYLKGDARNGDNSGGLGRSCEVRINNGQNVAQTARGTNLVTINRKELNVVESISYDTYSEAHPSVTGTGITDLKEKLDDIKNGVSPYDNNDVFVCLVSSDAIGWDEDLINKLYGYGME